MSRKRKFYLNSKRRPPNKSAPRPVPKPGALAKAFAKASNTASKCIAAWNHFVDFKENEYPQLQQWGEELKEFNDHQVLLVGGAIGFLVSLYAEWQISREGYQSLGPVVGFIIFAMIGFGGAAATSLTVRGFQLIKENIQRARLLIATGASVLAGCFIALWQLSKNRVAMYAEYNSPLEHTFSLPLVIFVFTCALGWVADRYRRYRSLKYDHDKLDRELDDADKAWLNLKYGFRNDWAEYEKVYEEQHGYRPDFRQEATDEMLFVESLVPNRNLNLDDNDADPPKAEKPAADPAPATDSDLPPEDGARATPSKTDNKNANGKNPLEDIDDSKF